MSLDVGGSLRAWQAAILFVIIALVVAGWFSTHYVLGRALSYAAIGVQIAAADALAGWLRRTGRLGRTAPVAFAVAFAALLVVFHRPLLGLALPVQRGPESVAVALSRVGPDDVVLSDLETAIPIPAFAGRIVAMSRTTLGIPDHAERRRAVTAFFRDDASDAERGAILARYRVRWICRRARSQAANAAIASAEWADSGKVAIDLAAMTEADDEDEQAVLVDAVDDPVIPRAHAQEAAAALHRLDAGRIRSVLERPDLRVDLALHLGREFLELTTGGGGQLDAVAPAGR